MLCYQDLLGFVTMLLQICCINFSEQSHDIGGGRTNFPYSSEEMDSLVSGLGRPFFKNGFLPSSVSCSLICLNPG